MPSLTFIANDFPRFRFNKKVLGQTSRQWMTYSSSFTVLSPFIGKNACINLGSTGGILKKLAILWKKRIFKLHVWTGQGECDSLWEHFKNAVFKNRYSVELIVVSLKNIKSSMCRNNQKLILLYILANLGSFH